MRKTRQAGLDAFLRLRVRQHSWVLGACLTMGCSSEVTKHDPSPTDERQQPLHALEKHEVTSPVEARDIDLELVAQARGWTYEQALADRRAADAVGEAAERLAKMKPKVFLGSIVADEPGAPPTLLVKGTVEESVRSMVAAVERERDVSILILDRQPFSLVELEERQHRVHRALVEAGYDEVATGTGIRDGARKIPAVVRQKEGLASSAAEVLERLPQDVREITQVEVVDTEVARDEAVNGGMNARDDGVSECTLGWVIGNLDGPPIWGITTAAHCTGINEALYYPEVYGDYEDLDFEAQHIGAWGDVEWHAPVYIPLYEFRAGSSDWRDTLEIESVGSLSINESVCQYAPPPGSTAIARAPVRVLRFPKGGVDDETNLTAACSTGGRAQLRIIRS